MINENLHILLPGLKPGIWKIGGKHSCELPRFTVQNCGISTSPQPVPSQQPATLSCLCNQVPPGPARGSGASAAGARAGDGGFLLVPLQAGLQEFQAGPCLRGLSVWWGRHGHAQISTQLWDCHGGMCHGEEVQGPVAGGVTGSASFYKGQILNILGFSVHKVFVP